MSHVIKLTLLRGGRPLELKIEVQIIIGMPALLFQRWPGLGRLIVL